MRAAQYDFAYQRYQRSFMAPLKTHHGEWAVRQGIFVVLRHQQTGAIGLGEISPLPWFGTETIEEAIACCAALPQVLTATQILDIPNQFLCTQFGLGTALESAQYQELHKDYTGPFNPPILEDLQFPSPPAAQICGLLPAGSRSLSEWEPLWQQGHRTFKWKIGVESIEAEWAFFQDLINALPPTANLRLDANGGLTHEQAHQWLMACDRVQSPIIEYLEQPLSTDQGQSLQVLASTYRTPIALDESVATLMDLEAWHQRQWPGYYILKPSIMGFPWAVRRACQSVPNPKIFSSVFEARVGRTAALGLARELGTPGFALGFGVDHWLAESPRVSISNSIFS